MNHLRLLLLLFYLLSKNIFAQTDKNIWREHLPYNKVHTLTSSKEKIFCATPDALFIYNKTDKTVEKKSKIKGLSDIGVGSIVYNKKHKCLIVGYKNGNIDIIKNEKIYNLPDLKQKNTIIDKTINHISTFGDKVYLSCAFGIVVLNIEKLEFEDTYTIKNNGKITPINQTILFENEIIALTKSGLFKAPKNSLYLSYYKNWTKDTSLILANENFLSATIFNNKLLVANTIEKTKKSVLQAYDGKKWESISDTMKNIKYLYSKKDKLLILNDLANINYTDVYNNSYHLINRYNTWAASTAFIDENNFLYVGTMQNGLVIKYEGKNVSSIIPNGPSENRVFEIEANGDEMLVTQGGHYVTGVAFYFGSKFNIFSNNTWKQIDDGKDRKLEKVYDVISFTTQKGNKNRYFASTWGNGLVEIENNKVKTIYNQKNTNGILGNKISDCTFDNKGNLWIVNSFSEYPFVVKTPDNKWYHYQYNRLWSNKVTHKILSTSWGDFWTISNRGKDDGLFVWNDNGTPENGSDDTFKKLALKNKEGDVIDNIINDIAQDIDGNIWLATSKGVVVFEQAKKALKENDFFAKRPQLEEDGFVKYLLEKENVSSIAIDGGNRKWFGTKGGGLFLVSADGTQQLANYNTKNSKIFSDVILTLEINPESGELFVGTDKGILSMMTYAAESKENYDKIYAFPNPIKGDYDGIITINGLMYQTDVKITDLAGRLVFHTKSRGGNAIWNGRDLNGNLVHSGIYTILCTNKDGSKSGITKILIVR